MIDNIVSDEIKRIINRMAEVLSGDNLSKKDVTLKIFKELDYDRLPTLVDDDDFDILAHNSNYGTLYRGLSANTYEEALKYVHQFQTAELFIGGAAAIRGKGIYTCYGDDAKEKTAKDYSSAGGLRPNGIIMKMVLKEDAKVIEYEELRKKAEIILKELIREFNKYDRAIVDIDSLMANLDKIKDVNDLRLARFIINDLSDVGHLAAIMGYDAIDVDDKSYLIVLNRGKIIMPNTLQKQQEENSPSISR